MTIIPHVINKTQNTIICALVIKNIQVKINKQIITRHTYHHCSPQKLGKGGSDDPKWGKVMKKHNLYVKTAIDVHLGD